MIRSPLWLALFIIACGGGSPRADSGRASTSAVASAVTASCDGPSFDGTGVGALRIGMTIDSLRRACRVIRDTIELRAEGLPARILTVASRSDMLEAEIDSGRVWRIAITSPRFRTVDSLGVGVPIGRLLDVPGVRGLTGEGALYLVSPAHCGLSFRVTNPKSALRADWTLSTLRRLPATSVVTSVLILGCKAPA